MMKKFKVCRHVELPTKAIPIAQVYASADKIMLMLTTEINMDTGIRSFIDSSGDSHCTADQVLGHYRCYVVND